MSPRPRHAPARAAFSLLEVLLALIIVALVMAAVGPALVGALRAQRQTRTMLEPLVMEQAAFALLRDDLLAAARPNGSLAQPLTIVAGQANGLRGDTLQVLSDGASPIHPSLAQRPPTVGQALVTWTARTSDDQRGLAWTRRVQANLLATGIAPTPVEEVVLDHLAQLTVEALVDGAFVESYDSDQVNAVLPLAVRISYAYLDADGKPGPLQVQVIDLPQVALDPTQQDGGA
jgi:prepilin-type N-terminal cleavage/methylation domain-containing protein